MKTCSNPKCKMSGIPDEAKFCPKCGSPLSKSFLYNGKGRKCDKEGLLVVDIRQCERISGLGWKGIYEFGPGLPKGYKGFYAVFEESENIQILVEDRKIEAIFIIGIDTTNHDNYTLQFWRDDKKGTSKQVIYYAAFKNDTHISNNKDRKRIGVVLKEEIEKLTNIYEKEVQDFFGMSYEKLMEHAKDDKTKKEQSERSNSPWGRKYDELNEVKEELQRQKQQWTLFRNERQKMLSALRQQSDFKAVMQDNINIIQYNRVDMPKEKKHKDTKGTVLLLTGFLILSGASVLCAVVDGKKAWGDVLGIVTIFVMVSSIVLVVIGLVISTDVVRKKKLKPNMFITNFYEPLIDRYMSEYECIIKNATKDSILESEIYEPEAITNDIELYIASREKMIEDMDLQMQSLLSMGK